MDRVVIVGGGFAGLSAARRLAGKPIELWLVDRRNHHLFQPLLYQVATAVLSPDEIASPIRSILNGPNAHVVLGQVDEVNLDARHICVGSEAIPYDALILAPGSVTHTFGHDDWLRHAFELKSLKDALVVRRAILTAFERAERAQSHSERRALLTFVVVGGGPTGVELAGAIAEMATMTLRHEFHDIHPEEARVLLIEGSDRLLRSFPQSVSAYTAGTLARLGVAVRTEARVGAISDGVVVVEGKPIEAHTVIWAAGVRASPLTAGLPCDHDAQGRVHVLPDLSVPGHPEVFVVGDAACVPGPRGPLEGVAPVALQEGWAVGDNAWLRLRGKPTRPFRYHDKGSLATIGKSRAVAHRGRMTVSGRFAWILWLIVHILYLAGFENRALVLTRWAWAYLVYQRGARLIYTDDNPDHVHVTAAAETSVFTDRR